MKRHVKGSIAIEFIITIPILIIVLFGIIQLGSLFYMRHQLLNAAYNCVRSAATNSNATNSNIINSVSEQLNRAGVADAQITLQPDDISAAERGAPITATITANAGSLVFISLPLNMDNRQISVSATMAKEY